MNPRLEKADYLCILRIVAIYACFSVLWIYFSDQVLGFLVSDHVTLVAISVYKGIAFILVTSYLLFQLIGRYIRQSKVAEQALRESEKRLNKAQEIAHLGSWQLDVADDVLTWSDEVYRLFGLEPQEFAATYQAFLEVVHPDDREAVNAAYSESLRQGKEGYEIEHRIVRKATGEIRYLHEKCEHERDEEGRVVRSLGMVHDVTDRKRAEEALKKAKGELELRVAERTQELEESRLELEKQNEQLRRTFHDLQEETTARIRALGELREKEQMLIQQNRMAAMGEMLGNIAHQWRQPLNLLGLKVQYIGLSHKLGEFSAELLEENVAKVMEIIQHMSQTIDDFRNFATPDKEKVSFRVDHLIGKTIDLVGESLKQVGIAVEVSITGEPKIKGYPNEYGQVLLNLLMNSRDAAIERKTRDALVTVRSWMEDDRSVVTVTDNAGGIDETIMDKIFDAYFTTKELGKGTGIGLFMSKTIIEKHMGGRLTVRNVKGGVEFKVVV